MTTEKTKETNGSTPDVLPMEKPEFYHERISYKMARDFRKITTDLVQCAFMVDAKPKDDANAEERQAVLFEQSKALTKMDQLMDDRDKFLSSIIKSLPRHWLVIDAPDKIQDGKWLDHVRGDYHQQITVKYQESNSRRREEVKN